MPIPGVGLSDWLYFKTWRKEWNFVGSTRAGGINFSPTFYLPTHEWVVIFAKQDFRLKSKGASGIGDVLEIPQERSNEHPAPFPVQLPMTILETLNQGTVCDPFMGSGSTGVACRKLGFDFIGFELSERYFEQATKRIEAC